MSRLDELIQELCPDGVEFKKLEDCCTILDKKRKPITKAARENGEYPYYGANGIQDYVANYIFDGIFILVGEDGSVITPTGAPVVNWAEGKIWVNNHAHIVEEKEGVLLRYLYHYIQTIDVTPLIHGNIPKLTGGDFKSLQIPVPPLEVQREIVRILDSFTLLTAELTAELTARKKQYDYYKSMVLSFGDDIPRKALGDICSIKGRVGWQRLTKAEYRESGDYYLVTGTDFREDNSIDFEHCHYVDKERYDQDENIQLKVSDVLLTKDGTIGKVAIIEQLDKPATLNSHLVVFRNHTGEILPRFLLHILKSKIFMDFAMAKCSKGTIMGLPQNVIASFPMPIPSLEKQQQIVAMLDSFDSICTDLNIGLPAEIEARQKQYEFYRDKLLTFKELEA